MNFNLYQKKIPKFGQIFFPNIGIEDNGKSRFFPIECLEIPNVKIGDLIQFNSFISLNAETFTAGYLNSTSFLCINNSPVNTEIDKVIGMSIGCIGAENMAPREINSGVVYRNKENRINYIVGVNTPKPLYLIHYVSVRSTRANEKDFVKFSGLRKDGSMSEGYYLLEALHFSS